MLAYFLIISTVLFTVFVLFSYWQERKYRNKPYYKLSDVGWRQCVPKPEAQLVHSIAFLGDVGYVATDGSDPVLKLLQEWQHSAGYNGTVLFLGDNLYPVGLPAETHRHHAAAISRLDYLLGIINPFEGRKIFLSGNHDWNKGRKKGLEYVLRQEKHVVEALQDEDSYLPRNGCPGPDTIQLAEGMLLLVINTQWWVQRGEKPMGRQEGCPYDDIEDFFLRLNKILRHNRHQRIVVAAHHPLYSNALHGGKFTIKQHIFPLTAAHKRIYIPLPIFGSIYPFYRQLFGAYEDMSHRKYRKMRKRLLRIFHQYSNIVYVAGHDHNLQHFEVRDNHYIVSGSGSKTSFVKKGGKATFTLEQRGFFVLNYYSTGELWIEAAVANENETSPKPGAVVFRKELHPVLKPIEQV
ncbi:metallophosphoesterase [Pontibacter sp. JH31]|uniref:Metallophosphoesterase n=1 Tax=Pontibacter aquaedesilientis TaxID=2766980 RepID=A0ABR7XCG6_9BACT|nr:metallophosphoesterase [Pontibacter aquaedesilientis]MBD1395990.1 metallophosphoesterase [Pontibacter aquaedesilientis]